MDFVDLYRDQESVRTMAKLVSSRVEAFAHRLLGIPPYEYSDGRYPGFSSEIVSCHFPLTNAHVEHINRVVVGHLMLRCGHLAYFANRLDSTLTGDQRQAFDLQLQDLGRLFRGECIPLGMSLPLIENHTMLGTLVQAERSAKEVLQYLRTSFDESNERQQVFLSYLLLLNSMDLSGYRYLPIILDPYWTARYIEFSSLHVLENYAEHPEEFALYRLRQLARNHISDFGDIDIKEDFHQACAEEFEKLPQESKEAIGTVRIRDALYLIIDFNDVAAGRSRRFPISHAATYVGFLKALTDIAIRTCGHTIVFRGDGLRTADRTHLSKLVARLQERAPVAQSSSFSSHDGVAEFTIDADGLIAPVNWAT